MAASTVVFITGAGRGIGKALAAAYLSRPNHTVVASVRDATAPKNQEVKNLPVAEGSKLHLVSIESTSRTDPQKAVEEIQAAGVSHIDIVIANSGLAPPSVPLDNVNIDDVLEAFNVNAVAPILVFQAVKPLLEKSSKPRWLSLSTAAASITRLEAHGASFVGAYGMSKAAQDWFTAAIHCGNKSMIAFAIHPGLVQTEMGNSAAQAMGMEKAPNTIEECSTKTMDMLDNATRDVTSGKFFNVIDGTEIPW